jgi:hypothetical protein
MIRGPMEAAVSVGSSGMVRKVRPVNGQAWSGEAPAAGRRAFGLACATMGWRMSGLVRVWRIPFGYLIVVWRRKQRWVSVRATSDLRRVYEALARRGVPKNLTRAALYRANPAQARAYDLD